MKTKILLTLALLASGCSPALEEGHKQLLRNALDKAYLLSKAKALNPPEAESRLDAFKNALRYLDEIPTSDDWGRELRNSGRDLEHTAWMYHSSGRIALNRIRFGREPETKEFFSRHSKMLTAYHKFNRVGTKFLEQNGGGQP
jgi:hypothetical protein